MKNFIPILKKGLIYFGALVVIVGTVFGVLTLSNWINVHQETGYLCDCDQKAQVYFLIEDALAISDTIPEVEIIEEFGIKTLCQQTNLWVSYGTIIQDSLPTDSCRAAYLIN